MSHHLFRHLRTALLCTLPAIGLFAEEAAPVIDSGDTAWMLVATALVLFMTLPGLALFYGGLGGLAGADYQMSSQLGKQLLAVGVTILWSGVVSVVVLVVLDKVIGLRAKPENEDLGLDLSDHDERGYIV